MNINEFNSSGPKPWLNPNFNNVSCNILTCNNIITPSGSLDSKTQNIDLVGTVVGKTQLNGGLTFITNANYELTADDLNRIKMSNNTSPTALSILYETAPLSTTASTGSVFIGRDDGQFGGGEITYIYNGIDRSTPNILGNLNAIQIGHIGSTSSEMKLFADGSFYIGGVTPKYKFNSGGKNGLNNDGMDITHITQSTSVSTGCGVFRGGVGIAKDIFIGGFINCPMPIGGLFMESNPTTTVVSPTPGTFVKILGTTTASSQNLSFTHSNNRLTYKGTKTAIFLLNYCITLNPSSSADVEFEVGISFNGSLTPQLMGRTHIHSITVGHKYSCSGVLIITLTTNQFVELFIANETNNTTNCIIEDMSYTLMPFMN